MVTDCSQCAKCYTLAAEPLKSDHRAIASASPGKVLRTIAMRHPGVDEGIACKGTAAESSAFKVRNKTFLFARETQMMVKLDESLPEATRLAQEDPSHYRVGSGWVTVKFGSLPAREMLVRWIAESYRIMAGSGGAAVKKTVRRPGPS